MKYIKFLVAISVAVLMTGCRGAMVNAIVKAKMDINSNPPVTSTYTLNPNSDEQTKELFVFLQNSDTNYVNLRGDELDRDEYKEGLIELKSTEATYKQDMMSVGLTAEAAQNSFDNFIDVYKRTKTWECKNPPKGSEKCIVSELKNEMAQFNIAVLISSVSITYPAKSTIEGNTLMNTLYDKVKLMTTNNSGWVLYDKTKQADQNNELLGLQQQMANSNRFPDEMRKRAREDIEKYERQLNADPVYLSVYYIWSSKYIQTHNNNMNKMDMLSVSVTNNMSELDAMGNKNENKKPYVIVGFSRTINLK
ncbi:hypothetical protein N9A28_01400 [Sulfurimonas sp.]|nr:hypothetical protein [Sulfurimonas sp.]